MTRPWAERHAGLLCMHKLYLSRCASTSRSYSCEVPIRRNPAGRDVEASEADRRTEAAKTQTAWRFIRILEVVEEINDCVQRGGVESVRPEWQALATDALAERLTESRLKELAPAAGIDVGDHAKMIAKILNQFIMKPLEVKQEASEPPLPAEVEAQIERVSSRPLLTAESREFAGRFAFLTALEREPDSAAPAVWALARLSLRAAQAEVLKSEVDNSARQAKTDGATWAEIGAAAGISASAAHRRWDADSRRKHTEWQRNRRRGTKPKPDVE